MLQRLSAYGYLYSYRKALWNTPLRLLYWLHRSSLVSVRVRKLNVSRSSSSHLSSTIWWHRRRLPIFHCRFAKIWYCATCHVYFLSLRLESLSYSRRETVGLIVVKEFLWNLFVDYKTNEKRICVWQKNLRWIILLFVLFLYF